MIKEITSVILLVYSNIQFSYTKMFSFILSVLRGQILPYKLINKIAYQHKSLRKL